MKTVLENLSAELRQLLDKHDGLVDPSDCHPQVDYSTLRDGTVVPVVNLEAYLAESQTLIQAAIEKDKAQNSKEQILAREVQKYGLGSEEAAADCIRDMVSGYGYTPSEVRHAFMAAYQKLDSELTPAV